MNMEVSDEADKIINFAQPTETITWEIFKEQMDYFLNLLQQEHLTDETKQEINKSMQLIVKHWANPVMIIPHETVIPYGSIAKAIEKLTEKKR